MKGRGGTPPFFQLPHRLLDLPAYINLPHTSKSLLMDIGRQFNGRNNGDFCVTLKIMRNRGWNSNSTMRNALNALIDAKLVMQTRQGWLGRCSLYAVTWLPINECAGKLDVSPTVVAPVPLSFHPSLK